MTAAWLLWMMLPAQLEPVASPPEGAPSADAPASQPSLVAMCGEADQRAWLDALDAHPALEAARHRADALVARGSVEAALPDPSIFVEGRGVPINEPWNIGRTPMGGIQAGVQTQLPWLPRRWAMEEARAHEAESVRTGTDELRLDMLSALLDIVIEDEAIEAQIELHEAREQLLQSLAMIARANAMVGAGGQTDAVLLEARAARVRARIEALGATRQSLAGRWAAILPEVPLPTCRLGTAEALDAETAPLDNLEARPALEALEARTRAARARKNAAVQGWIPEPTLKAGYVWRADYGSYDGIDFVGGMVSIPLPLFAARRTDAGRAASAEARGLDADRRAFLRASRGRREALLAQIDAETRRIEQLERGARPVAVAAAQVAEAAYRSASGRVGPVIEAERMVLDVDLAIVDARAQRARLRIALWRLMGGPTADAPDPERAPPP